MSLSTLLHEMRELVAWLVFSVVSEVGETKLAEFWPNSSKHIVYSCLHKEGDCFCGLVVRVLGYRSRGPGSIPGTTKKKSSGSGTGSTQPREYN
jgi:hypothetical protein